MSDEPRDPQLGDLFQLAIETALAGARTMLPGKVVSYNSTKQQASVQILIKESHIGEDEERVVEAMPELQDVPVWHFGGNANGRITVPVVAGDYGMVMFASSSIARWKLLGGIVDPGDDRHHDISDCVFIPGLHAQTAPTTAPTDAIVTHGNTKLGAPDATELVAWHSALTQLADAFDEWVVVANDGGAALKTILTALTTGGWPQGATKVKAK